MEGKAIVDIPSAIKSVNRTNWYSEPLSLLITFERVVSYTQTSSVAMIGGLKIQNLKWDISILVDQQDTTSTSLILDIFAQNATSLLKLTISYIYYQQKQEYNSIFQIGQIFYQFNNGMGKTFSDSTTPYNLAVNTTYPMNITGSVRVIPFLCGMVMIPFDNSLTFNFQMAGRVYNQTVVIIAMTSNSQTSTVVGQAFIKIFIYNQDLMLSPSTNYYHIYSGAINSPNYYSKDIQMTFFNTIVGLNSFAISNSDIFSFDTAIDPSSGITISSDQPSQFSYVFQYVTLYSNYCDYKTPYYLYLTQQCLSTCPGSSEPDNSSLSCLCYQDYFLVDIDNCLPQPTLSSDSSILIGTIVGGVGGVILIIIIACIVKIKCRPKKAARSNSVIRTEIYFDNPDIMSKDQKQTLRPFDSMQKIQTQTEFVMRREENKINIGQSRVDVAKPIFYVQKQEINTRV